MTSSRTFKAILVVTVLLGAVYRLLLALDHSHFNALIDDSFYSLDIARNIAEGRGVTYGGQLTNGFQPLFVFLVAPLYACLDSDVVALHGALLLLALAGVGTGLLLFDLLRRMGRPLGGAVVLVIWSLSPYFIGHGVNGLETGLTAFCFVASAWYYYGWVRGRVGLPWRRAALQGLLLGFAVLARIDLGLWAAVLALDWLAQRRAGALRERLLRVALCAACATLVASPWFLFNQLHFGSPLPTSGSGVRLLSLCFGFTPWGEYGNYFPIESPPLRFYRLSLASSVRDILNAIVVPLTIPTMRGFLILLLVLVVAAWRQVPAWLGRTAPLWLLAAGHVAAYTFWIHGSWFYARYYMTTVCALTLAAGLAFPVMASWRGPVLRRWSLTALAGLALALGLFSWNSIPQALLRGGGKGGRSDAEHQIPVEILRGVVPPGAKVGGFQSGALGYYGKEWQVVNLDGVVNAAAQEAIRAGTMSDYLRAEGIDWMLDLDWIIDALYVQRSQETDAMNAWTLVKKSGRMCLYQRTGWKAH